MRQVSFEDKGHKICGRNYLENQFFCYYFASLIPERFLIEKKIDKVDNLKAQALLVFDFAIDTPVELFLRQLRKTH